MKIGFDGKRAMSNMTGLGNYSRLIIESLGEYAPHLSMELFSPTLSSNPRLQKILKLANLEIRTPHKGEARFGKGAWRTYGITNLLRPEGVKLYHGLSNELPLNIKKAGIPTVLTMHDVIYRRLPYCYSAIDRKIYDYKYGRSCKNATRIIAVSERTKLDVMEYYGVPESRIDVVYQGCDNIFRQQLEPTITTTIINKYKLPHRYIIQVGSIERRKNAELTLQGLHKLPQDIKLVLVGRRTDYTKQLLKTAEAERLTDRIVILENVPFTDLPHLYHGALMAAYPSHYEGFGIPILEALCCGTPVVAATGSCLEEAGGEGALYVNPNNPKQMADVMFELIDNMELRAHIIEQGKQHAQKLLSQNMAEQVIEVYKKALQDFKTT